MCYKIISTQHTEQEWEEITWSKSDLCTAQWMSKELVAHKQKAILSITQQTWLKRAKNGKVFEFFSLFLLLVLDIKRKDFLQCKLSNVLTISCSIFMECIKIFDGMQMSKCENKKFILHANEGAKSFNNKFF
jgi:hypothetical protein